MKTKRQPHGCWEWQGAKISAGYGLTSVKNRLVYTHRLALEEGLGRPLKDGCLACHHCDNLPCCNPLHLYEGTHQSNVNDMVSRGRRRTKLTTNDVIEIKRLHSQGMIYKKIATLFGVSESCVQHAGSGLTFKEVS